MSFYLFKLPLFTEYKCLENENFFKLKQRSQAGVFSLFAPRKSLAFSSANVKKS